MTRTIVARAGQAVLLLVLATTASFALVRLSPGDPGALIYGPNVSASELSQLRDRWGLDAPIHLQYLRWLANAAQGDLGRSYLDGRPVTAVIVERIPATLELTASALLLALLAGTLLGTCCAMRPNQPLDRGIRLCTTILYSTPSFWLGLLLILLFAVGLGWLPSGGARSLTGQSGVADLLMHLALPVLALAARDMARFARLTRASVMDVLSEEYVRTAVAKGLSPTIVNVRHVLRNALLPDLALLGAAIPGLLGGAIVIETIFSWPGMGRLVIESSLQRNYPVIMGEVLVVAALALAGSLLADLACRLADPRLRYKGSP